jgi:ABC-type proline/glycine betaine transport system permease subunit
MMSWTQWLATMGVVLVANFLSLAFIFGAVSALNERRKRQMIEPLLDDLEKKITTELDFMNIVQNFDGDEDDRGRE